LTSTTHVVCYCYLGRDAGAMIDFIGWTLVHAAWQGGVIAVGVAVALWLARHASASIRYVIALAGLGLAVVAPVVTVASNDAEGSVVTVVTPIRPPITATGVTPAVDNAVPMSPVAQLGDRIDDALPWLVAVWLLGMGLLSMRVLAGVTKIRRLARDGVWLADARVRAMVDIVAERLGLHEAIRVLQSARVDVPMVIGWVKPVVVVPVSLLAGITPAQLEMLVAHELAHIRRYDTVVNLAQTIVETLLFFHPAVWWMSARVREEREHCCDDLAIAATGVDRGAYGAMLLELEESRVAIALAVAATDGPLLRRVRRIVFGPSTRIELGATWFAGVATMLMVLFIASSSRATATVADQEANIVPATTHSVAAPEAALPPTVQLSPRSTPMPRSSRSLLAGAALSVAAATVPAQTPPNFAGRWVAIGEVTPGVEALTIEQTRQTLTLINNSGGLEARVTYRIEDSERPANMRVSGPIALRIGGLEASFDTTQFATRTRVRWQDAKFEVSATTTAPNGSLVQATMTLSLDVDGILVIQVDIPAIDSRPPTRTFSRLKRA
jgi:beta-lactamase regulating signal transducer with metallopeptidase domain